MFGIGMIILVAGAGIELGCAVGLFWAAMKVREYTRVQEREDERIQREWAALADRYEELAQHAEDLSKSATVLEDRERLQAMSRGYAEIYGGSKPDPNKVN